MCPGLPEPTRVIHDVHYVQLYWPTIGTPISIQCTLLLGLVDCPSVSRKTDSDRKSCHGTGPLIGSDLQISNAIHLLPLTLSSSLSTCRASSTMTRAFVALTVQMCIVQPSSTLPHHPITHRLLEENKMPYALLPRPCTSASP